MKAREQNKPKKLLITFLIATLILITLILLVQRSFRIRSLPLISNIANYYDEHKLKREILKDPSSASTHERLAWLYFKECKLDKMEAEYKTALKLNPKSLTSLYWLGHHYEAKLQFDEALKLYQHGAKADPTFSMPFYYDIGLMYNNLGRPTDALCAFEIAKSHPEAFNGIMSGKENSLKLLDQNIDELRSRGIRCVPQIIK